MPKLQGIWSGLIGGTAVQTLVLAYLTMRCDWDEEVHNSSFLPTTSYYCHKWTGKSPLFSYCLGCLPHISCGGKSTFLSTSSYQVVQFLRNNVLCFLRILTEIIACVAAGKYSQYTNEEMGQHKMKLLNIILRS
jgi:hypothetical protein